MTEGISSIRCNCIWMISKCKPLVIKKKAYEVKSMSHRQLRADMFIISHHTISDSFCGIFPHPVFLYKDLNPSPVSMFLSNTAQHVSPLHRPSMLDQPVLRIGPGRKNGFECAI